VGQTATRDIWFRRTKGGANPVAYQVEWVGNDGTFTSAASLDLPREDAVALRVTISPQAAGVHSAFLNLRDQSTGLLDYQVLNTVVATVPFSAANGYRVVFTGSADRPDRASFFFTVPSGTPAFRLDEATSAGRVRVLRFHPYGVPYDSTSTTPYQTGGSISRTVGNPTPGVWEVTVDTSRTSTVTPATFTVTGSILGVTIAPPSWTIDPATIGTTYTQAFTFTNPYGPFTGGAVGTALGSAFATRPTVAAGGADQVFEVVVTAGSTSITARIGNPSDPAADLDLYLYDCTAGSCTLRASSAGSSATEQVSVSSPSAGLWRAVVRPYAVPSGSTAYAYADVFANGAMFGSVAITDPPALHATGTSWSATASVGALAVPAAGRHLQGSVQVRTGTVVLGQAEVALKNVQ
jgi:hypothetical protein